MVEHEGVYLRIQRRAPDTESCTCVRILRLFRVLHRPVRW